MKLNFIFAAMIAFGLQAVPLGAAERKPRPNVLFIMTDDLGPWALASAGNPNARTPNLDRFRTQGAILTNCYSPTAVCSPARASVLTSRYGTEVGIRGAISENSKSALSPDFPTWPKLLKQAGYATALVGKYHLGYLPASHPTRVGYDEFSGFIGNGRTSINPQVEIGGKVRDIPGWTPDILTDLAMDFVRRKQDQPWALSLHYWATHANQLQKSPGGGRTWLPLSDADWNWIKDEDPILPNPDYPQLDIPTAKRMMREYLGSLHSVDRNVGRLLTFLDQLGLSNHTVVIFTSDHGFNVAHHGIWHKGNGHWLLLNNRGSRPNLWDNSIRVPALVRWPGKIAAGSTIEPVISHLDWFPTIAAIANESPPAAATIHGRNVLPVLLGGKATWPAEFYSQQDNRRSFQTERWKLVRFFDNELPHEFYDREHDPDESVNLIDSADPVVQAAIVDLDARLLQKMAAINDPALKRATPNPESN